MKRRKCCYRYVCVCIASAKLYLFVNCHQSDLLVTSQYKEYKQSFTCWHFYFVCELYSILSFCLQHFEWRKEKDIDNILQEDFSYWEDEFPYYTDGVDFVGRPGKFQPASNRNIGCTLNLPSHPKLDFITYIPSTAFINGCQFLNSRSC